LTIGVPYLLGENPQPRGLASGRSWNRGAGGDRFRNDGV